MVARWLGWGVPSLGTAFLLASLWMHPVQPVPVRSNAPTPQLAALNSAAAQSYQNALPVRTVAWTNTTLTPATNGARGGLN